MIRDDILDLGSSRRERERERESREKSWSSLKRWWWPPLLLLRCPLPFSEHHQHCLDERQKMEETRPCYAVLARCANARADMRILWDLPLLQRVLCCTGRAGTRYCKRKGRGFRAVQHPANLDSCRQRA
jgi:hypothetical protein